MADKLNDYRVTFPGTRKYDASWTHVQAASPAEAKRTVAVLVGCEPRECKTTRVAPLWGRLNIETEVAR